MGARVFRAVAAHRTGLLQVLVILLSAAVLRLTGLDWQSLWYDEGVSLSLIRGENLLGFWREFVGTVTRSPISERFQPLYFPLLFLWSQFFGLGDAALRSFSALLGLLSVAAIMAAALAGFGRRTAVLAGIIAGVSAFGVHYSQEVRPYSLAIFLCSLAFLLFIQAIRRGRVTSVVGMSFAAICALAVLSNIFSGLLLAALALGHLVFRLTRPGPWIRLWSPAAVMSLAALAGWLALVGLGQAPIVPRAPDFLRNLLFVPYGFLFGQTFAPPLGELRGQGAFEVLSGHAMTLVLGIIVAAGIGALVAIRIRRLSGAVRKDPQAALEACLWASMLLAGVTAGGMAYLTGLNWLPRHAFFLFPPISVLLARLFHWGDEGTAFPDRLRRVTQAMALAGLIGANGWSLHNYFLDTRHGRDDYRAAAEYLRGLDAAQGPIVMLWGEETLLRHYGVGDAVNGVALDADDAGTALARAFPQQDKLILFVNRPFYWNPRKSVTDAVSPRYRVVDRKSFQNIDIYRVVRTMP